MARHAKRVSIHLARLGQARIDGHRYADRCITHWRVDLRIISHGERHRKRGTARQVHKNLLHVRAGVPQVDCDFLGTERSLDQLSTPSAQRNNFARIGVGAHLQTIKIGRLRGKARISHDDVIIAAARKGDLDSGIESEQRRVFTARDHTAMGVENLEQRIDRRSATPRLDFDHSLFTSLGAQAEQVALGPAQCAIQRERGRRQRLRVLHVVVGVGERAGPRFVLGEFGKRADSEELDIRNALARDDSDRVDAGGKVRGRLDQERRVATLALHRTAPHQGGLVGSQQRERSRHRRANLRAFTEIPAGERQCEGLALLRSARLQFGDHRLCREARR